MALEWKRQKVETIEIKCPYCNWQIAPPVYPYCKHTVFVYVDPSGGDPGFDFITPEFAAAYFSKFKVSEPILQEDQEDINISKEAENQFLQGKLPPFHNQEIWLYENLISDDLFISKAIIIEVTEQEGFYPTRLVVAFQNTSITKFEGELSSI